MNKQQDTRDRLINATINSIYRYGYSDTTVAKISELAEVSLGTVHHYFSGKEDLLDHTMRRLLAIMHDRVIEGIAASGDSPRTKLWAVIQSVLSEEQSEDKIIMVWMSFWVQAEFDDKLRRVRDVYHRRLQANVRTYLRQILHEIGASNVEERANSGTTMLISMVHGVWLSYAVKEDPLQDIAGGRLLVWECLEMLLSRAREPLTEEAATVSTSASLLNDVSFEIIGADVKKIDEWRQYVVPGMRIYMPHFRGSTDLSGKVRMASQLVDAGLAPVAHLAARNIRDEAELERMVAGMRAAGVEEFLLLGGGERKPIGEFNSAMQIMETKILQRHQVCRVGFAGHPEEHPEQTRDQMRQALIEKISVAKTENMECYIVTQFCFATRPFFEFLDWARDQKFGVPVRLGVAGRVNAARLMKFASDCGIGRSLSFLKRQFNKTMHLINYSPEGLLAELAARIAVRHYDFPVGIHFYPFGATEETLALVSAALLESNATGLSTTSVH